MIVGQEPLVFTYCTSPQMSQMGILLVFVVDVEEYDAVVSHVAARAAVLQPLSLFAALLAPVVDQPVVTPAHVLLQAAMMHAMHPAVGIARIFKQSADHLLYALMSGRIDATDFFHFGGELFGWVIDVYVHFFFSLFN